jgi:hypothetical protein
MPRTNPSSKRSRAGLIAAVVIVPAVAAGALWLRNTHPVASPVALAPVQAAAPSSASPAPALQPAAGATPSKEAMASTPAQPSTPSTSAPAALAPGSAGQRAHIDPKTGRLRETEHDDAAAAVSAAPRRAARTATIQSESAPQEFLGPGGAVGVTVPEELHTALVATRLPDGRIVFEHAAGPKAAGAKVRKDAAKTTGVKEERNDR